MKVVYCTVLNAAFVPRALALQRSIAAHTPNATFAFFCIDDAAATLLRDLAPSKAWIVAPAEFETARLLAVKPRLKLNEYCWTCKPFALHHALDRDAGIDWAVWLDADMFTFGDLDSPLRALPDANVALTPHSFTPEFAAYEPEVGRYNAGYVAFRNSADGRAALEWWTQRCLEECSAKPVNDTYADQKYLNELPTLFPAVAELSSLAMNAAPWNILGKTVGHDGTGPTMSGVPLLLYHYQAMRVMRHWAFDLYASRTKLPPAARQFIYRPYADALRAQLREVSRRVDDHLFGVDGEFAGAGSLMRTAKHLAWARNIHVRL